MKRTFCRSYRKRIPRKLKKAVKYGIEHRIMHPQFPARIIKTENGGFMCSMSEAHYWVIKGRRTKWKIKACNACKKSFEESLKEMYLWNVESIKNYMFDNTSRA